MDVDQGMSPSDDEYADDGFVVFEGGDADEDEDMSRTSGSGSSSQVLRSRSTSVADFPSMEESTERVVTTAAHVRQAQPDGLVSAPSPMPSPTPMPARRPRAEPPGNAHSVVPAGDGSVSFHSEIKTVIDALMEDSRNKPARAISDDELQLDRYGFDLETVTAEQINEAIQHDLRVFSRLLADPGLEGEENRAYRDNIALLRARAMCQLVSVQAAVMDRQLAMTQSVPSHNMGYFGLNFVDVHRNALALEDEKKGSKDDKLTLFDHVCTVANSRDLRIHNGIVMRPKFHRVKATGCYEHYVPLREFIYRDCMSREKYYEQFLMMARQGSIDKMLNEICLMLNEASDTRFPHIEVNRYLVSTRLGILDTRTLKVYQPGDPEMKDQTPRIYMDNDIPSFIVDKRRRCVNENVVPEDILSPACDIVMDTQKFFGEVGQLLKSQRVLQVFLVRLFGSDVCHMRVDPDMHPAPRDDPVFHDTAVILEAGVFAALGSLHHEREQSGLPSLIEELNEHPLFDASDLRPATNNECMVVSEGRRLLDQRLRVHEYAMLIHVYKGCYEESEKELKRIYMRVSCDRSLHKRCLSLVDKHKASQKACNARIAFILERLRKYFREASFGGPVEGEEDGDERKGAHSEDDPLECYCPDCRMARKCNDSPLPDEVAIGVLDLEFVSLHNNEDPDLSKRYSKAHSAYLRSKGCTRGRVKVPHMECEHCKKLFSNISELPIETIERLTMRSNTSCFTDDMEWKPGHEPWTTHFCFQCPERRRQGEMLMAMMGKINLVPGKDDMHNRSPILYGKAGTGKSLLLQYCAMKWFMPTQYGVLETQMDAKFWLSVVVNRFAVFMTEFGNRSTIPPDTLKKAMVNEDVVVNAKNVSLFTGKLNVQFVFASNNFGVVDSKFSLLRRFMVFHFNHTPSVQDSDLNIDIERESGAMLFKCMMYYHYFNGMCMFHRRGKRGSTIQSVAGESISRSLMMIKARVDSFYAFMTHKANKLQFDLVFQKNVLQIRKKVFQKKTKASMRVKSMEKEGDIANFYYDSSDEEDEVYGDEAEEDEDMFEDEEQQRRMRKATNGAIERLVETQETLFISFGQLMGIYRTWCSQNGLRNRNVSSDDIVFRHLHLAGLKSEQIVDEDPVEDYFIFGVGESRNTIVTRSRSS